MSTIDHLPEANNAPMVDITARNRLAAWIILAVAAVFIAGALALTIAAAMSVIPDRQLLCAALFGAAGGLFSIAGVRMLRSAKYDRNT